MTRASWWNTRTFAIAAILASAIPLLWPAIPPLIDVPGHIGRYHVMLDLARSPDLQRHWTFQWRLVGNLGVDLLVYALAPIFGLIPATKIVVIAIPMLFVAGLIRLSHACDGQLSPAAAFAFPLAYGAPLQFGFINYMLSAALALLALAAWITLGRQGRFGLRAACFVPVSCLLWVAHSFGWGMFGLFAFAIEVQRLRAVRIGWAGAIARAILACLPLALPLIPMAMAARSGTSSDIAFDGSLKTFWLIGVLRERWAVYDALCAFALIVLLIVAIVRRHRFRFEPICGLLALVALGCFLALPRLLMGGAYVDMRMAGMAIALGVIAIRPREDAARGSARMAMVASAFFLLRTATTTISFLMFAHHQRQALAVLDHIPKGAAVLVSVDQPCIGTWGTPRLEHIDGIGIATRNIFDNGQWTIAGQQLIGARHPDAGLYRADPSQLAFPDHCRGITDLAQAMHDFDRGTFAYVWTLDTPSRPALAPDVRRIWHNGVSSLYRVTARPIAGRGHTA